MEQVSTRKGFIDQARPLTRRDMLAPLFRKKWVIVTTFLLISAASALVSWGWASKYYVASMQIVVGRERTEPAVTPQPNAPLQDAKIVTTDDVASEVALLQGRDMLLEIAETCHLAEQEPAFGDRVSAGAANGRIAAALEGAAKALAASLRVEPQKTSRVIEVHYGSTAPPETTACVLQTLEKLYLEKHLRLQRPAGAFEFFARETDKYQRALAESERELQQFSASEGAAAPDVLRTNLAGRLVEAQADLYRAREAIAADKRRIETLRAQTAVTPARSSSAESSISANLLLDQLHSTLLAAELKRTQLLLKYEPSYPLVTEIEEEIAQTKQAITDANQAKYINTTTDRDLTFEYLRQDQAKTEADLASEEAREAALHRTLQSMQADLVSLDAKAVKQAQLLREVKANEGNYLLYLEKREQERTSDALDQSRIADVAIAVPASVPLLPAHNPNSMMLSGLLLAFFGAIAAGYLAEFVDPSFRTPDEVTDILKIPVIASFPRLVA